MSTKYLAKLLGLTLVLLVLSMLVNRQATVDTMSALFSDTPLMFVTGVFTLILGLAVVLAHNRWNEGPLAAVVTFYGWAAVIKGAAFLYTPPPMQTGFYQALHFEGYFYGYFVLSLVLGGYLLYGGFAGPQAGKPSDGSRSANP